MEANYRRRCLCTGRIVLNTKLTVTMLNVCVYTEGKGKMERKRKEKNQMRKLMDQEQKNIEVLMILLSNVWFSRGTVYMSHPHQELRSDPPPPPMLTHVGHRGSVSSGEGCDEWDVRKHNFLFLCRWKLRKEVRQRFLRGNRMSSNCTTWLPLGFLFWSGYVYHIITEFIGMLR